MLQGYGGCSSAPHSGSPDEVLTRADQLSVLQAEVEAAEILTGICRLPINDTPGMQLFPPLVELDGQQTGR